MKEKIQVILDLVNIVGKETYLDLELLIIERIPIVIQCEGYGVNFVLGTDPNCEFTCACVDNRDQAIVLAKDTYGKDPDKFLNKTIQELITLLISETNMKNDEDDEEGS